MIRFQHTRRALLLCFLASVSAFSQAPSKPAAAKPSAAKPSAAKPAATPALEPGLYARLQTSLGLIVFKMYEQEAPRTVANFRGLAMGTKEFSDPNTHQRVKRRFYDGIGFHRVIPGFMIQVGDPTGTGRYATDFIGEEYWPSLKFDRIGRVAMAHGPPGSSSCQFFITDTDNRPDLNGRYTIFGQVVSGQSVVTKISQVPRDPSDHPATPPKIIRVTFQRVGPEPK